MVFSPGLGLLLESHWVLYLGTLFPGQRLSLLGFSRLPHHHPGLFSLKSGLPGSYSASVPSG